MSGRVTHRQVLATDKDGPNWDILIVAHDGLAEWGDCAECGVRLDGASEMAPKPWDGSCWKCGAPASRVGLRVVLAGVRCEGCRQALIDHPTLPRLKSEMGHAYIPTSTGRTAACYYVHRHRKALSHA